MRARTVGRRGEMTLPCPEHSQSACLGAYPRAKAQPHAKLEPMSTPPVLWSITPPEAAGVYWCHVQRGEERTVDLVAVTAAGELFVLDTRSDQRFAVPVYLAWAEGPTPPRPPGE